MHKNTSHYFSTFKLQPPELIFFSAMYVFKSKCTVGILLILPPHPELFPNAEVPY